MLSSPEHVLSEGWKEVITVGHSWPGQIPGQALKTVDFCYRFSSHENLERNGGGVPCYARELYLFDR